MMVALLGSSAGFELQLLDDLLDLLWTYPISLFIHYKSRYAMNIGRLSIFINFRIWKGLDSPVL